MNEYSRKAKGCFLVVLLTLLATVGASSLFWVRSAKRPNSARVSPLLNIDSWTVVDNGRHNGFLDMFYWKGNFYLAYRSATNHTDLDSRLVVLRSADARNWEEIANLTGDGEDLRDPKFADIGGRLFLYILKNRGPLALPYTTVFSVSSNGTEWSLLQSIEPADWVFSRPKTNDQKIWYVPATSRYHNRTLLLKTMNGLNWEPVAQMYAGALHGEVAITFLPDGTMLSTVRVEGGVSPFGSPSASTELGISLAPYTDWSYTRSLTTRLDGPRLFEHEGTVYAAGRYEPDVVPGSLNRGGYFNKKRTAIFVVKDSELIHLTDLPSGGDTSYPGVVRLKDQLYIAYYTSSLQHDYPWLMGMYKPTSIRLAQVSLSQIGQLSKEKCELPGP